MNAYEQQVLQAWRSEEEKGPSLPAKLASGISGRMGRVLRVAAWSRQPHIARLVDHLRDAARQTLMQVLEQAATAKQLHRVEQVASELGCKAETAMEMRMLPLDVKDEIGRRLARSQTAKVTAEGAAAGLAASLFELIPGLQSLVIPTIIADLTLTIYMMAQSAVQIGYSYGYSLHDPEDIPHFLIAMAPYQEDANLIEAKVAAYVSMRESGLALTRTLGEQLSLGALTAASPALNRLVDMVATRIATDIAEKRIGMLVPIAGAVLQGSINSVFARTSYREAKRYFQKLHFNERYGDLYST